MFAVFFFIDAATTEFYTLSLHDALPISARAVDRRVAKIVDSLTPDRLDRIVEAAKRSEEHTSELQSLRHLVCRLLLEKKKKHKISRSGWRSRRYCEKDATNSQVLTPDAR